VEVNIDYILMLVTKYHESNCKDKTILTTIDKTINSSTDVDKDWQKFVKKQEKYDLSSIITDEKLKSQETQKFINNAFRDGALKTTGTDINKILPPLSRFGGGRAETKRY
jgi:type I restriction enzyme R subunit